jgi:hypothetical protein
MSILLFFAAAQLTAQVGDWRHVMTTSDGTTTLIDGASIRRAGSLLTFWQKELHRDGKVEGTRVRLFCESNTWQILYQQVTDPNGHVVSTLENRLKPQEIRAGSAMEEVRARICPVLVHN